MYDHLGLKVQSLDAAVRFYRAALEPLGHRLCSGDADGAGFGPAGAPAFWLYRSGEAGGRGVHIAFKAADRGSVDAFHAAGLAAGGRDNGPPGLRCDYAPTYYAAFLIDPDGNNVEAVAMT